MINAIDRPGSRSEEIWSELEQEFLMDTWTLLNLSDRKCVPVATIGGMVYVLSEMGVLSARGIHWLEHPLGCALVVPDNGNFLSSAGETIVSSLNESDSGNSKEIPKAWLEMWEDFLTEADSKESLKELYISCAYSRVGTSAWQFLPHEEQVAKLIEEFPLAWGLTAEQASEAIADAVAKAEAYRVEAKARVTTLDCRGEAQTAFKLEGDRWIKLGLEPPIETASNERK